LTDTPSHPGIKDRRRSTENFLWNHLACIDVRTFGILYGKLAVYENMRDAENMIETSLSRQTKNVRELYRFAQYTFLTF